MVNTVIQIKPWHLGADIWTEDEEINMFDDSLVSELVITDRIFLRLSFSCGPHSPGGSAATQQCHH